MEDFSAEDSCFKIDDPFHQAVVDSIVAYLGDVEDIQPQGTDDWCTGTWENDYLRSTGWGQRCQIICDILARYKERLLDLSLSPPSYMSES